jgi:hypothetical protein
VQVTSLSELQELGMANLEAEVRPQAALLLLLLHQHRPGESQTPFRVHTHQSTHTTGLVTLVHSNNHVLP